MHSPAVSQLRPDLPVRKKMNQRGLEPDLGGPRARREDPEIGGRTQSLEGGSKARREDPELGEPRARRSQS